MNDRNLPAATGDVYGFFHIATLGPWKEIVADHFSLLRKSGLYRLTKKVFIGIIGPHATEFLPDDDKAEVIHRSQNEADFEFPTLTFLHEFCKTHECKAFYIHTKGVSRNSPMTDGWRRYMAHFIIERHADCLAALDSHDVCGVNWTQFPWPHFSGNFWWARSQYVAGLEPLSGLATSRRFNADAPWLEARHECERWIGSHPSVRPLCFHQSQVDHYQVLYPPWEYDAASLIDKTPVNLSFPVTKTPRFMAAAASAASEIPHGLRVAVVFDKTVRPDTTGIYTLERPETLIAGIARPPRSTQGNFAT